MTDDAELAELIAQDEELEQLELLEARDSLAVYCGLHIPAEIENDEDLVGLEKLSLPARYIPAEHHRLLIEKLEALERGWIEEDGKRKPLTRLAVFMPPGSAKSTYCSALFPAWYLGRNPTHCVIQGSYGAKLAKRFGRRARNAFGSPEHQAVFGVGLGKSAEENWETARGGEYAAFGMESGITGFRADLWVIDDPIKGRKEADSKTERDNVWETYKADVRTRMKPGAKGLLVATRWHEDDPAGRILPPEALGKSGWFTAKDGERWYVISLAAVIETKEEERNDPLGRKLGEILWPEWFTEAMLLQERRTQGGRNWSALYQQKPRPDEGAILKREHWRKWPYAKPPKCEYVVTVYDTAFEEGEQDDYSARTTWGVFQYEEKPEPKPPAQGDEEVRRPPKTVGLRYCAILLHWWEDKVEFPELRREAREHYRKVKPDRVLVEKKSSGHSLIQELRRARVPVAAVKADTSKLARAHAANVVLEDGCIWTMDYERYPQFAWARQVVDKCAAATFIKGDPGNDTPDTCVHAWNWFRRTFHLQTKQEAIDEDEEADEAERERAEANERRRLF